MAQPCRPGDGRVLQFFCGRALHARGNRHRPAGLAISARGTQAERHPLAAPSAGRSGHFADLARVVSLFPRPPFSAGNSAPLLRMRRNLRGHRRDPGGTSWRILERHKRAQLEIARRYLCDGPTGAVPLRRSSPKRMLSPCIRLGVYFLACEARQSRHL